MGSWKVGVKRWGMKPFDKVSWVWSTSHLCWHWGTVEVWCEDILPVLELGHVSCLTWPP